MSGLKIMDSTLIEAIKQKSIIRFSYEKVSGEITTRKAEPYGIYISSDGSILVDMYQIETSNKDVLESEVAGWRTFKLSQIREIAIDDNLKMFEIKADYSRYSARFQDTYIQI